MGKKKGDSGTAAGKIGKGDRNKADRKLKKLLAEIGEADVKEILQQKVASSSAIAKPTFVSCYPPSPRCNTSLAAHPERDELFFFGGDFFNGSKAAVYDDLFQYKIKTDEWFQLLSPADHSRPLPRASHQALISPLGGGQLWMFGGEFTSPSQLQFHHFSDLWAFHLKECRWENISASGECPSPRSGHKMVEFKRHLVVFGGFFETNNHFTYFNDVHVFNPSTRKWKNIKLLGESPAPRSNAQVVVLPSISSILVYGGYSKSRVSKSVDAGVTHSDMYLIQIDGIDAFDSGAVKTPLVNLPWRWVQLRQSGEKPNPPRCGCSSILLPGPNNRIMFFGGVADQEQEDAIHGLFSNEIHIFDSNKKKWTRIELKMAQAGAQAIRPRMNTHLAIKGHMLYMYGGMCEVKDRQITLSDFYSINLNRMDTGWTTLIPDTAEQQEWLESSDEEEEGMMEVDGNIDDDDSDEDSSDDDE